MGQIVPPAANQVNFSLNKYTLFPSNNVIFELGTINVAASDSGESVEARYIPYVTYYTTDNGGYVEEWVSPQRSMGGEENGAGGEASEPSSLYSLSDAALAQQLSSLLATILGIDPNNVSIEAAIIPQATQVGSDTSGGTDILSRFIPYYLELSDQDGGQEAGSSGEINALTKTRQKGLGAESKEAIETMLTALQQASGIDMKKHVFVVRLGTPWGMVKVIGLGKIQR